MAERKSGPVKPPTIDLEPRSKPDDTAASNAKQSARETAATRTPETARARRTSSSTDPGTKPETKSASAPEAKSGTETPRAAASVPASWPRIVGAGLAGTLFGGALGLAGAYGLAVLGYWPNTDTSAEIASLNSDLTTLYVKKSDIGGVIDRAVGEVQSGVDALETRIATLENQPVPDTAPDLSAYDTRLAALETGVSDLGAKLDAAVIGGSDADAAAALKRLSERMDTLSANMLELETRPVVAPDRVTGLESTLSALETEVSTLSGGVTALQSAPAPEPVDLRLPLALSGLTGALETGAPFDRELALIAAALPDLSIPASVSAAAGTGLGAPAALEAAFRARVPDMLAAKPADSSASWTDQAFDRLKALVALRPVAADGDTSPEGLISHIETALGAREYAVAVAAFEALPAPVRDAAGGLEAEMVRFADAADLVARARSEALALAGAAS